MKLWKSKGKPEDLSLIELTTRIRGFVYDSQVSDAEDIAKHLGCPDISDEVFNAEIEASDSRVEKISHLTALLYVFAHAMAEGMVEHQRDSIGAEVEVPSEVWAATRKQFTEMAANTLVGSISQLVDMGILSVNRKVKNARRPRK